MRFRLVSCDELVIIMLYVRLSWLNSLHIIYHYGCILIDSVCIYDGELLRSVSP